MDRSNGFFAPESITATAENRAAASSSCDRVNITLIHPMGGGDTNSAAIINDSNNYKLQK